MVDVNAHNSKNKCLQRPPPPPPKKKKIYNLFVEIN